VNGVEESVFWVVLLLFLALMTLGVVMLLDWTVRRADRLMDRRRDETSGRTDSESDTDPNR